jgi:acetolactate synthase-1/3 small subunit
MKVRTESGKRAEIRELTDIFRGRIVDVSREHVMIEISGKENKVEAFVELMRPFGIIEMVRTGRVAMLREGTLSVNNVDDREELKATET